MNEFVGTSPWAAITKDVARKRRGPIVAAISYVGVSASEVLPLRNGDFLVCDASERAIKQGVTSAKSLASYLRTGVKVFSHEGLHSKVVATESFAWVGSTNASRNSRDNLTEASIRIEGPAGRNAFSWALSLATEDAELSTQDVRVLAKLPVSWEVRGGQPTRSKEVLEFPKDLKKLVIVELPYTPTEAVVAQAERRRIEVKKSLSVQSSKLDWFENKADEILKVGEWFVPVYLNRLGKPSRVERLSDLPRSQLVWFSQLKTSGRCKIADLRSLVGDVDKGFDHIRVTEKNQISKIRKIYEI
jgi:hypothetical protein